MDHQFGKHRAREEQDVVFITLVGDVKPQEMQRLLDILAGVVARHGRYGTVIDTRQLGVLIPEARRLVTQWPGVASCFGNAIFGERMITRVMMTMAARAIQVLNSQRFAVTFTATESEARAWLKQRGECTDK